MTVEEKADFLRMQDNLENLRTDVKEIRAALLGDSFGNMGMVNEIKELKKKVNNLEAFKNKVMWVSIGFSGVAAMAYDLLKGWLK